MKVSYPTSGPKNLPVSKPPLSGHYNSIASKARPCVGSDRAKREGQAYT